MTEASHSNKFHRPWVRDRQILNRCSTIEKPSQRLTQRHFRVKKALHFDVVFFVAADAYNQSLREFFGVTNVNSFLSRNKMKIASFSNCFEQLSLAWQFVSISSPADVSLCRRTDRWSGKTRLHQRTAGVLTHDITIAWCLPCRGHRFCDQ